MPGVDDGATDINESRDALAKMQAQGIQTVITTPHIRASLLEQPAKLQEYLASVEAGWQALNSLALAEFPGMRVEHGFEVMLDVPRPDLSNALLRLAGTRFVLVEFPFFTIPPNSAQVIFDLKIAGQAPIVAHPERYANVADDLETVAAWRRSGAFLQMNAGSLLGQYGPYVKKAAWTLLKLGWADYLCSDYHAHGEYPAAAAREALAKCQGAEQLAILAFTNPDRVISGEDPLEVPCLREHHRWWQLGRSG